MLGAGHFHMEGQSLLLTLTQSKGEPRGGEPRGTTLTPGCNSASPLPGSFSSKLNFKSQKTVGKGGGGEWVEWILAKITPGLLCKSPVSEAETTPAMRTGCCLSCLQHVQAATARANGSAKRKITQHCSPGWDTNCCG